MLLINTLPPVKTVQIYLDSMRTDFLTIDQRFTPQVYWTANELNRHLLRIFLSILPRRFQTTVYHNFLFLSYFSSHRLLPKTFWYFLQFRYHQAPSINSRWQNIANLIKVMYQLMILLSFSTFPFSIYWQIAALVLVGKPRNVHSWLPLILL